MADMTWKNVEDVVTGDLVVSPQHDGTSIMSRVTGTVAYEDRDIYELTMKGRSKRSYRCADNHIVPYYHLRKTSETGPDGWAHRTRKCETVLVEEHASVVAGHGKHRQRFLFTNPAIDLPEQEYTIHPYVMGVLLGDGGLSGHQPQVTVSSAAVIERLRDLGVQLSDVPFENGCWQMNLLGDSSKLVRESELFGKLSVQKYVPEEYKLGSLPQRLELLGGLIDTDGSRDSFSSSSEQLANDFAWLVHSVGGFATVRSRTTKCNGKTFQSWRVSYAFAEHKPVLCCEHKAQSRTVAWKDPRRRSFDCTLIGNGTVYGFTLDSPSEWYITDDWIVTHNTGKTLIIQAMAKELGFQMVTLDPDKTYNSLLGETEKNMRRAMDCIQAMAPCIVFIDEVDQAFMRGAMGDSGVSQRIFKMVLEFMANPENHAKGILFAAATNQPKNVDAALTRPGRFGDIIPVLPPRSGEGRWQIVKGIVNQLNLGLEIDDEVGIEICGTDLHQLYTGAEIKEVVVEPLRWLARTKEADPHIVTEASLRQGFEEVKPSTRDVFTWTKEAVETASKRSFIPPEYLNMTKDKALVSEDAPTVEDITEISRNLFDD